MTTVYYVSTTIGKHRGMGNMREEWERKAEKVLEGFLEEITP